MAADCGKHPIRIAAMPSAQLFDFQEYRRRQALRDCGTSSRRWRFLWVHPDGSTSVGEFRPAQPTATEALQSHGGRAG